LRDDVGGVVVASKDRRTASLVALRQYPPGVDPSGEHTGRLFSRW
jgi:hypothetical protein